MVNGELLMRDGELGIRNLELGGEGQVQGTRLEVRGERTEEGSAVRQFGGSAVGGGEGQEGQVRGEDVVRGGQSGCCEILNSSNPQFLKSSVPQNEISGREEQGGNGPDGGAAGLAQFSYYKSPIRNTLPIGRVNIVNVYKAIKGNRYKETTMRLRSIRDVKAARAFKATQFDYVTFSGVFTKRENSALVQHSGLFAVDFDHVGDVEGLKERLLRDEYFETELLFVSPSGDGLKWVVGIDVGKASHLEYALGIGNYLWQTYGQKMDRSGKDVGRACFLPWDEGVWINPKYLTPGPSPGGEGCPGGRNS